MNTSTSTPQVQDALASLEDVGPPVPPKTCETPRRGSLLIKLRRPLSSYPQSMGRFSVIENDHASKGPFPSPTFSKRGKVRTMFNSSRLKNEVRPEDEVSPVWDASRRPSEPLLVGNKSKLALRSRTLQRNLTTDNLQGSTPAPPKERSNTVTAAEILAHRRPALSDYNFDEPGQDRMLPAPGLPRRETRAGSLTLSLRSKASKLVRRRDSEENLTSLRTFDLAKEFYDTEWEGETGPSLSIRSRSRQNSRAALEDKQQAPSARRQISSPFNFQHLTHADRSEFEKVQEATADELVSEFSVVRASQAPKSELRGIRAAAITGTVSGMSTPFSSRPSSFRTRDLDDCHAVTTNEHTASHACNQGLDQVTEEAELGGRTMSVSRTSRRAAKAAHALRSAKSLPSVRAAASTPPPMPVGPAPTKRLPPLPTSHTMPALPGGADRSVPHSRRTSVRTSTSASKSSGEWENSVDWCYDHNAEASSNFDYVRSPSPQSIEQFPEPIPEAAVLPSPSTPASRPPSSVHTMSTTYSQTTPSHHIPRLHTDTPALTPSSTCLSAHSSFDSVSEALTPPLNVDLPANRRFSVRVPNFSKPVTHNSPRVSGDMTSSDVYDEFRDVHMVEPLHYDHLGLGTRMPISRQSSQSQASVGSSRESCYNTNSLNGRRQRVCASQDSLPDMTLSKRSSHHDAVGVRPTYDINLPHGAIDRRSVASLVRDVAQKNLLARLQNGGSIEDATTDFNTPLPIHPAFRGDAAPPAPTATPPPPPSLLPAAAPTSAESAVVPYELPKHSAKARLRSASSGAAMIRPQQRAVGSRPNRASSVTAMPPPVATQVQ